MNLLQSFFYKNKLLSVFIILIILVTFLLLVLSLFFGLNPRESGPSIFRSPTPTSVLPPRSIPIPKTQLPQSVKNIPTLSPDRGYGVDIDSEIIKNSAAEIKKIRTLLPYTRSYTLSTGVKVFIVIPSLSTRSNYWTLPIQIFGINYRSLPDSPDYLLMKDSFREAAGDTLQWVSKNDAYVKNIIVSWGDEEFIHTTTSSWLVD